MLKAMDRCIANLAGERIAENVMEGREQISRTTDKKRMAEWVKNAIGKLDASVDEKTKFQIMESCGRNCAEVNKSVIERAKARRRKHKSVEEFLKAEQEKPAKGTRLVREDDVLYQVYTPHAFTRPMRCYCSLLRGLPVGEKTSRTYCHCAKGFVRKLWEDVLERPVKVDLVQSAMSGADECKFAIHL
jgi:hypothetical protein